MHKFDDDLFESILDDITPEDNSSKSSQTVAANSASSNGRLTLPDGQEQWRYRLKITKHQMGYVRTEREVEDEMREIIDNIFASCRYVYDYEICLIEDPTIVNYVHKSHIDVLFNFRKTTFVRAMRTLFIPLMRLYYDNQNYRFIFIDLLNLQKPAEFDSLIFKYMYSVVNGDKAFD